MSSEPEAGQKVGLRCALERKLARFADELGKRAQQKEEYVEGSLYSKCKC